jgi:phage replication O-like protein O
MDNVQLENGYTPIANVLLEQMAKIRLSPTQYRLIFAIWRYTYGFKRKEHELSLAFLANLTGCDKRQIQRELRDLSEKRIINQTIKGGRNRIISFNKHYSQWNAIGKSTIGDTDNGEIDNGNSDIGDTTIGETINTTIGETTNVDIGETTNQEIKYINKNLNKKYTADFEQFYAEYPRPEEKRRTYNNWRTCRKTYTAEQLLVAARNYKKAKEGTEKTYLKTSANFLGREKPFEDYLDPPPEEAKEPDRKETNWMDNPVIQMQLELKKQREMRRENDRAGPV